MAAANRRRDVEALDVIAHDGIDDDHDPRRGPADPVDGARGDADLSGVGEIAGDHRIQRANSPAPSTPSRTFSNISEDTGPPPGGP